MNTKTSSGDRYAGYFLIFFGLAVSSVGWHPLLVQVVAIFKLGVTTQRLAGLGTGALFVLAGSTVAVLGVIHRRSIASKLVVQTQWPNEPWKWRKDWRAKRVICNSWPGAIAMLVFAVLWNLLAWTGLIAITSQGAPLFARLFVAIFCLVGVVLAACAIWGIAAAKKWSGVQMELDDNCIGAGETLLARVCVAKQRVWGAAASARHFFKRGASSIRFCQARNHKPHRCRLCLISHTIPKRHRRISIIR